MIKIKLDDGAFAPIRAHNTDAGLDLKTPSEVTIKAGSSVVIDTGVHVAIPEGYFGKLESKSGLNVKHSIVCLGGVIDCGYTGSIQVKLYNLGDADYTFATGDKIVQMIVQPCELCYIGIVDSLEDTDRGANGFGSTGR